ncbi:MAG: hypothetical protein B7X59_06210 [Polaromonas sp. 39-63-203]|jgi:4-amino-4-deoxy-L-arabinose transferase-like glycosyltransferase|uniref:ArnT family glycosyltransferase n=1 Tax=Polaromonas sp. TaxID=1869339 RepID=UPI000BD178A7|nr:glycosyltransferase family 39 protein [Polaromonas sp.]OYY52500.1 MAG: hypothetical protein B7Y54_06705 [Polaromonas sp. 35-63-240]OYY99449.1 MAG: hypothetical protein B7Y42_05860 [Polaromonas sp. 28-63-22]OYZ83828.1 MAG: hypothetical protein B7Y03_07055 [Polaromonas sp. 24-62-144]OZA98396.1 MAG: hypothetical protein B7X59_06210 [Polaromonas sp. 39-63-203]HQS32423.1 glycosyltransferase family 39 protein [Polaromonas sp.]
MSIHERTSKGLAVALAAAVVIRLLTMGLYPFTDTTEARYAEVARKMVELGDWVTPWYDYGVPFWAKPPLSTWLTALSFKVFGFNEFAGRLPHFLVATVTAWLVWDWIRRSHPRTAQLSLALLCGTLVFSVAAFAVMTDMSLALATTMVMRGFWCHLHPEEATGRLRWDGQWLLFAGLGLGMLAKGPVVIVLSGLPILGWALATGNFVRVWKSFSWIKGLMVVVAIAAPWYVWAEMRTPGFWAYFFVGEHWKRFTETGWTGDRYGSAHASARGTIWLLALGASLPWPLLLPWLGIGRASALAAVTGGQRQPATATDWLSDGRTPANVASPAERRSWAGYLVAWVLAPCLFFTAAGNILWTYVLPAMPALAIGLATWLASDPRHRRVNAVIIAGVLFTLAALLAIAADRQSNHAWKTAKGTVAAYAELSREAMHATALNSPQQQIPLFFLGDRPYSASFYSRGTAKLVSSPTDLLALLEQKAAFVALTKEQTRAMPDSLKTRLQLRQTGPQFDLYSSRPNIPRQSGIGLTKESGG